jgi:hypothetical protein
MIQALLQMMIITVIPVLMMFSAYEPKTVVTISFALFALQFITFWWELAGWLDDRLITILYDNMPSRDWPVLYLLRILSAQPTTAGS